MTSLINYREIKEVKRHLDFIKNSDQPQMLLMSEGEVLRLKVRVTDPELFQLVSAALYVKEGALGVPGADILSINLGDHKMTLPEKLREAADLIENDSNKGVNND